MQSRESDTNQEHTMTEQAEHHADVVPISGSLAITPDQTRWTAEQVAALMDHCGLKDVPQGDAYAFLHLCQRTGLDPWAREIYLIGRKVREKNQPDRMKYQAQTGIDGYRHIAERTGVYGGRLGPYWCGPDGNWKDVWLSDEPPAAARVGIVRKDIDSPFYGTVSYREYVPMTDVWENGRRTGEQKPQGLWSKMPAHMLAKCAEALAIRTAFPRQVGGVYVEEEMHQADAEAEAAEKAAAAERRAQQRRELVRPWGPGEPASPADTAPADVVEGDVVTDVVTLDRDGLWGELQAQAQILGQTVPAMTRRWVKANRKNIDDATAEELLTLVEANRARVAEAAKAQITEVAETTALPDDVTEVTEPHEYADWGGKCITCLLPEEDPIHTS
jgi:phage recombination protein Bet